MKRATLGRVVVGLLSIVNCRGEPFVSEPERPGLEAGVSGTGPTSFYASPSGTPTGLGSLTSPWDLQTALSKTTLIEPGDTLWMRGGLYNVPSPTGGFVSSLQGAFVRNYPGERPILDGVNLNRNEDLEVLKVNGSGTSFFGFVVRDSYSLDRTSQRPHLVVNNASGTRYYELVLHDGGDAFYNFASRTDVIIRGCVIYNSGSPGNSRPAHAFYLRSNTSPGIRVESNITFNQFGYGVHAYSDVAGEGVNYITVTNNAIFNSGSLGAVPQGKANIIVGVGNTASGPATAASISNNFTYKSPSVPGKNLYMGLESVQQGTATVSFNWAAGGDQILEAGYWNTLTLDHNTFLGTSKMVALRNTNLSGLTLTLNKHWSTALPAAWSFGTSDMYFLSWKAAVGATTDSVSSQMPAGQLVAVHGVHPGRANVILYNNPQNLSFFNFNPPPYGIFAAGDSLEVRHVFNMFDPPIAGGRCCGTIQVPVVNPIAPKPYGMTGPAPSPGRAFAAYAVTKVPR